MYPKLLQMWNQSFARGGLQFRPPKISYWYNKAGNRRWVPIARACDSYQTRGDGRMWGAQHRQYKPNSFYCPPNETIYLDWKFLQTIGFRNTRTWGSGDDARPALVIAHEYAHHVQKVLRWPNDKRRRRQFANHELHADCYAGVFFAWGERNGLMERGDVLNANTMLGYLGDADGTPWNFEGAHGSATDRLEWFTYGYESEAPRQCDRVFN
jgi:uncharacterized protein